MADLGVSFIALALKILGFERRPTGAEDAPGTPGHAFFQSATCIG